jgi:hypothetical protein
LKEEFDVVSSQQVGDDSRWIFAREAVRAAADSCNPEYAPLGIKMLAELYFSQGAYLRAERLYLSALTATFREKGSAHPDVKDCVEKLIKIYRLTDRKDKLQDLLHQQATPKKGSQLLDFLHQREYPKKCSQNYLIRPLVAEDATTVPNETSLASTGEFWYSTTAYRATEILSNLFTADKKRWFEIMPDGIACGDYRWKSRNSGAIMGACYRKPIYSHERITLFPLSRKQVWPNSIAIFLVTMATMYLLVAFLSGHSLLAFPKLLLGAMLLYPLALVCHLVYKAGHKNIIHLERRTGMVVFQHLNKKVSFKEMEGHVTKEVYSTGRGGMREYWMLDISHRECKDLSMAGFECGFQTKYWMVRSEWEFFQQFMAINLPLPDTPQFEPYRHLDPTTEAYDRQHGRARFFWRNMNDATLGDESDESSAIIENYPWLQPGVIG